MARLRESLLEGKSSARVLSSRRYWLLAGAWVGVSQLCLGAGGLHWAAPKCSGQNVATSDAVMNTTMYNRQIHIFHVSTVRR